MNTDTTATRKQEEQKSVKKGVRQGNVMPPEPFVTRTTGSCEHLNSFRRDAALVIRMWKTYRDRPRNLTERTQIVNLKERRTTLYDLLAERHND